MADQLTHVFQVSVSGGDLFSRVFPDLLVENDNTLLSLSCFLPHLPCIIFLYRVLALSDQILLTLLHFERRWDGAEWENPVQAIVQCGKELVEGIERRPL